MLLLCNNCPALFREQGQLEDHDQLCHSYSCRSCSDSIFKEKDEFIDHFFTLHFYIPPDNFEDRGIQCSLDSEISDYSDNFTFDGISKLEDVGSPDNSILELVYTDPFAPDIKLEVESEEEDFKFALNLKEKFRKVAIKTTDGDQSNISSDFKIEWNEFQPFQDDKKLISLKCTRCSFKTTNAELFEVHEKNHAAIRHISSVAQLKLVNQKFGRKKQDLGKRTSSKTKKCVAECSYCAKEFRTISGALRHEETQHKKTRERNYSKLTVGKGDGASSADEYRTDPSEVTKSVECYVNCCIPTCNRRLQDSGLNHDFFPLPDDHVRRAAWLTIIWDKIPEFIFRSGMVVCSDHIKESDLVESDNDQLKVAKLARLVNVKKSEAGSNRKPPRKDFKPWRLVLSDEAMDGKTQDEIKKLERSCPVCGEHFMRFDSLTQHVSLQHALEKVELDFFQDRRVCDICAASIPIATYRKHLREHSLTKTHVCPKCGVAFHLPSRLRIHLQTTSCSDTPSICSFCGREFFSIDGLRYHVNKEHQLTKSYLQPVACSICDKVLATSAKLQRHIRHVHNKEPFSGVKKCPECGIKRRGNGALEDHMNAFHTRQWSFVCRKCSHHYSQKRQAYRHHKNEHGLLVNEKNLEQMFEKVPWIDTNRNKKNK